MLHCHTPPLHHPLGAMPATTTTAPKLPRRMAAFAPLLLLLCLAAPVHCQTEAALKSQIKGDVASIKANVFSFWQQHGLDPDFGGFHGTLTRAGAATSPTNKGIIQQARHMFAFSLFHQAGYSAGSPTAQQMAKSAYGFVTQHMRDPGSGLWYTSVSREGRPADTSKSVYAQWFAIYGLSHYSQAFGDAAAKELALSTFKAVDSTLHKADTGGYDEGTGSRRTLNVLMHGTEALSALHRVSGDGTVLSRLLELMGIISTRLATSNGLTYEDYSAAPGSGHWSPASGTINYGHNLEVAWLVLDTLNYLQSIGAISSSTAQSYREAALGFGAAAIRDGYDRTNGGVYESNGSRAKVWWVQAEAMLGAWKLHQRFGGSSAGGNSSDATGQQPSYLQALAGTARFVLEKQTDQVYGEQFWQVNTDGTWSPTGDPEKDTKGNRWKASYHSSRAPLFLEKWL